MKEDIPDWVFKTPKVFYALAVFFFFGYFALGMIDIRGVAFQYGSEEALRSASLRVFLDALREGAYMFGTGLWIHVMIHLWGRVIVKLDGKSE